MKQFKSLVPRHLAARLNPKNSLLNYATLRHMLLRKLSDKPHKPSISTVREAQDVGNQRVSWSTDMSKSWV
ncbi:hypothetical protein WG66_005199 [Moniliophthora roreri]|nr:hypothetical protein WG66_005199 [Moniliophthora roreri]